jgi:copper chaperone
MTTRSINVPSISCAHCKASIEGALRPLAGVVSVSVDVERRIVEVSFDPQRIDVDAIVAAIEDQGHEVKIG